jgi:hypothetical protein
MNARLTSYTQSPTGGTLGGKIGSGLNSEFSSSFFIDGTSSHVQRRATKELITPKKFSFFSTDSEKTLLGAEPVGCLLKNEKKRTYRTFGYIEPRGIFGPDSSFHSAISLRGLPGTEKFQFWGPQNSGV